MVLKDYWLNCREQLVSAKLDYIMLGYIMLD